MEGNGREERNCVHAREREREREKEKQTIHSHTPSRSLDLIHYSLSLLGRLEEVALDIIHALNITKELQY